MKPTDLLPARLRRFLLAVAEIGHEANRDLKLGLLAERRSTFIDIGANRGQFARFMSAFYDRVVVFEPIGNFVDELRGILAPNCVIHGCALADFTGPATFFVPTDENPRTLQTASLMAPAATTAHTEVVVEVKRLDDFAFADVAFIKVDVEGAEHAVLLGAIDTLQRCRPVLLIEIEDRHTGGQSKRVFDLLLGLGYRAFIPRDREEHPTASAGARLLRGARYLARPRTIELTPIGHRLDGIYDASRNLNEAFGAGYVNNFLFVPH